MVNKMHADSSCKLQPHRAASMSAGSVLSHSQSRLSRSQVCGVNLPSYALVSHLSSALWNQHGFGSEMSCSETSRCFREVKVSVP